ncbi:MAG: type III secretion T3S chaperone [Verrucomicrobia bacterium]|nr:type III secretion T3S chaperone [Verrucomicrobiota bacterium]
MKRPVYPLEEIALIKQKRLEEAEKMLKEKKENLAKEQEKLRLAQEKCNLIKKHKYDKMRQHMQEMDEGTTSDKIEVHERYIKKVVDDQVKAEEKKVSDQKKVVKSAEEEVEKARQDYLKKTQEVEKMKLHRKEWELSLYKEEVRLEGVDTDEIGLSIDSVRRRKAKKESLNKDP